MKKTIEVSDGRKLSYLKNSTESNCTLIFEAGLGSDYKIWDDVLEKVKKKYSFIAYDRAGLGESDYLEEAQSLESTYCDFKLILETEKTTPPYIFIGHSLGCAFIKYYATKFPASDVGLVFVDGSDSKFEAIAMSHRDDAQKKFWQGIVDGRPPAEEKGINREINTWRALLKEADELEGTFSSPTAIMACENLMALDFEARKSEFPEDLVPFSVLEKDNNAWIDLHLAWKEKYENSTFEVVSDSAHFIQKDKPIAVATTIDAMIERITNNN